MSETAHVSERRHDEMEGSSASARLERIERKLDSVCRGQETQDKAIRELQDWRLEMNVYLRQLRWTLVMAGGALLVGTVNILLELVKHAP